MRASFARLGYNVDDAAGSGGGAEIIAFENRNGSGKPDISRHDWYFF